MTVPTKPTITAAGDLVSYQDLDEVREFYDGIWSDVNTSSAFTDVGNSDHRYGWGQATVTVGTAAQYAVIESDHINELIAQVNAGLRHQDTGNTLLSFYSSADVIEADHLNDLSTTIDTMKTNKYDLGSDATPTTSALNIVTSTPWQDGLYCIARYDFSDYEQARYFFNSGGELSIQLQQVGSVNNIWDLVFNAVGDIFVGAETTTNLPIASGVTGISGGGFYDMNNTYTGVTYPTNWKLLFTAQGFWGGTYASTAAGLYSGYGMYSSRQVRVWGYCREVTPGGAFRVYLRVELVEDVDDGIIGGTFDADFGYNKPDQSPNSAAMLTSVANYVTVGATSWVYDPTVYTWNGGITVSQTAGWTQDSSLDQSGVVVGAQYVLTTNAGYTEGNRYGIQLQTENVADTTVITFEVTGVQAADITYVTGATSWNPGTMSGTFTVGSADTFVFDITAGDGAESESLTLRLPAISGTPTVTVPITDA